MIKLTKEEVENIRKYKYATNDWTTMDYVFNPWWEFLVNRILPKWLAPNIITVMGIIFPVISLIVILQHDFTNTIDIPFYAYFLNIFGVFWYQTMDAIDGKQARKTNNCSPLGQILDHNLD